tara:strand:+ start:142 stop:333 length:192 start_codon:yes stop_codon:yes gene_type:complete
MPDRIAIGLNIIPNPHPSDEHHRKMGNKKRMAKAESTDRMRQSRKRHEDKNSRMGSGNHGIDN